MTDVPAKRTEVSRAVQMLNSGMTLEQVATALKPAETQPTASDLAIRRIGVMRQFDPQAVEVCQMNVETPQLEFTVGPHFATISKQEQRYSVREQTRQAQLRQWQFDLNASGELVGPDADTFRQLNQRLAAHFASRGPEWELEHLHHLLIAIPGEGVQLMKQMIDDRLPRADTEGDGAVDAVYSGARDGIAVAAALDIIDVVKHQVGYLPIPSVMEYDETRRLVETWNRNLGIWHRSRRYIPRPKIHQWFADLLDGKGGRILELHAPGGSGKTMSLRWLITHHCMPRRLPIAHIDFDHYFGQALQPWQLLLRCVEQLNGQVPHEPFKSLLASGRDLEGSLATSLAVEQLTPDAANLNQASVDEFVDDVVAQFQSVLASHPKRTCTVVVDTFEEAMVRGLTPVAPFVALLTRFVKACPSLRLIICGRYPLEHRGFASELQADHPEQAEYYQTQRVRHRLPHFDDTEMKMYLEKREVADCLTESQLDRLFTAAARIDKEVSDGDVEEVSPFHLSLIADLLEDRSPDDFDMLINDLDEIQVIYLIERVILRIQDMGVRWLLRYGVVPRELTKEFFLKVILPHLEAMHRGESSEDEPEKDRLPKALQEQSLFIKDTESLDRGPDHAWNRLRAQASADSWVHEVRADRLNFPVYVREPMRALLRQHQVLRSIHRDAAEYFARKSEQSTGEQQRAFANEMVYHQLQFEGEPAAAELLRQLEIEYERENYEFVQSIAEELWHEEYRSGETLVSHQVACRAQEYGLASALHLADLAKDNQTRDEWLKHAQTSCIRLASDADIQAGKAVVSVRQRGSRKEWLDALQHLDPVAWAPPLEQLRLQAIARAHEKMDDGRCVAEYAELVERHLPKRKLATVLVRSLSLAARRYGATHEQTQLLLRALQELNSEESLVEPIVLLLQSAMRPESAWTFLQRQVGGEISDPRLRQVKWQATGKNRPDVVVQELEQLDHSDPQNRVFAAWIHGLLCHLGDAEEAIDDAFNIWTEHGQTAQAAWCHLEKAEFWLHHHGNLERCRQSLAARRRSLHGGPKGTADSIRERLLEYEIAARHEPDHAPHQAILTSGEKTARLEIQLRCALTVLQALTDEGLELWGDRAVHLMVDAFRRMPDAIARSNYPWLLATRPTPKSFVPDQRDELIKLLALPEHPVPYLGIEPAESERAWAILAHGHVLRLVGEVERAIEDAREARHVFSQMHSMTGMREVWRLLAACGELPAPEELDKYRGARDTRFLEAFIAIEQAEYALAGEDVERAVKWFTLDHVELMRHLPTSYGPRALLLRARTTSDDDSGESYRDLLVEAQNAYTAIGDDKGRQLAIHYRSVHAADDSLETMESGWPVSPCQTIVVDRERWSTMVSERSRKVADIEQKIAGTSYVMPHELVDTAVEDPRLLCNTLCSYLGENTDDSVEGDLVIAAAIEHLVSAALPWEWTRFEGSRQPSALVYRAVNEHVGAAQRVAWLQSALQRAGIAVQSTGKHWSHHLSAALRRFAEAEALPINEVKAQLRESVTKHEQQPQAAILMSTAAFDQSSRSGADSVAVHLRELYLKYGFECQLHQNMELETLLRLPRLPDVVHIVAPYHALSTGVVEPDLGYGSKTRMPKLGEAPRREKRVRLLILDGPGESGNPAGCIRQLMLRNAAGTLYAQEHPNVLALGVSSSPDFSSYEKLLEGLVEGRSLREIYTQLFGDPPPLESWKELLADFELPRLPPSLWCADPDLNIDYGGTP